MVDVRNLEISTRPVFLLVNEILGEIVPVVVFVLLIRVLYDCCCRLSSSCLSLQGLLSLVYWLCEQFEKGGWCEGPPFLDLFSKVGTKNICVENNESRAPRTSSIMKKAIAMTVANPQVLLDYLRSESPLMELLYNY
jgi:hypothetical protein